MEPAFREEDRAMNRNYRFSPLLFLALALPAVSRVEASEIRDRAGMFSPEAVKKAQTELDRLERKTRIPVVIETIDSIPGLDNSAPSTARRRAIDQSGRWALQEGARRGRLFAFVQPRQGFFPFVGAGERRRAASGGDQA